MGGEKVIVFVDSFAECASHKSVSRFLDSSFGSGERYGNRRDGARRNLLILRVITEKADEYMFNLER